MCVCLFVVRKNLKKCRVGKAFVGTTWAAAQHPCSLCLETPVSLVPPAYIAHSEERAAIFLNLEPVIRELPISFTVWSRVSVPLILRPVAYS